MNHAHMLRAIALGAEQVLESTDADLVRQAADRIDWLEDTTNEQILLIEAQDARIERLKAEIARLSWLEVCVQSAINKGEYLGYGIDEAIKGLSPDLRQPSQGVPMTPDRSRCRFCYGNGIEPCSNCSETDDHTCHLDGEEYGPSPCRMKCYQNEDTKKSPTRSATSTAPTNERNT